MRISRAFVLAVLALQMFNAHALAGDDAAPGDIVINEFMANPDAVADFNGEWIELSNTTDSPINIDGWTIADSGTSHTISNGGTLTVPANGKIVLCEEGDSGVNGGVTCDYDYGGFLLNNGGDSIILTEDAGTVQVIAQFDYSSGFAVAGQSAYYIPSGKPPAGGFFTDNGNSSRWGVTDNVAGNAYGAGDFGTPGATNTQSGEPGAPTAITILWFTTSSEQSAANHDHLLAVVFRSAVPIIMGVSLMTLASSLAALKRRRPR